MLWESCVVNPKLLRLQVPILVVKSCVLSISFILNKFSDWSGRIMGQVEDLVALVSKFYLYF